MAQATEGAHVLFLTVDLCSLCVRINDPSPTMFVAAALFGDGAAGVLLRNMADGSSGGPRIHAVGEWCWPQTEHIMGWDIKDDGFGVVLSPELPSLMRKRWRRRCTIFSIATAFAFRISTAFCSILAAAS